MKEENIQSLISDIEQSLIRAFAVLDGWFDKEEAMLRHILPPEGRTLRHLLAQALQGNRLLMSLVVKGSEDSLHMVRRYDLKKELAQYEFGSGWPAQEKIEDTLEALAGGQQIDLEQSLQSMRSELRQQLAECLYYLDLLDKGEGILFLAPVYFGTLPRADVYQCMYFVALSTRRHAGRLDQLAKQHFEEQAE